METRVTDRLGSHAAAWDALVAALPVPSPFLRSWWLEAVAGPDARYLLVFDGDELVGGLPLERTRRAGVEVLQFIGTGPLEPDHLDVVTAADRADEVVAALRSWLGAGDRLVDLIGVRAGGRVLDAVPGRGEVTDLEVAPYADLPADADAYLAARGGRTRSNVTRAAKRLAKAGVTHRLVTGPDATAADVDTAMDALRHLHDGRWGERSGFLAAWEPFERAARAGIAVGEVLVHLLVDATGEAVAVEVDLAVAGRTSFYQAGRRTDHELRGSGSVLRAEVVRHAIASGHTEFDLLRGAEPYKTEWADHRRGLVRVRRGTGPRSQALVAVARANVAVQDLRNRRRARTARTIDGGDGRDAERSEGPAGRRARIAFYTDAAQIGGAETVAKTLLSELDERFDVVVVGSSPAVLADIAAVRPTASTLVLPAIEDRRDVGAMVAHRRAFRAIGADIVHANLSEGSSCQYALLAALSIPGQRIVVTENSPMGVRSELSRRIKSWSAPRFDAHIGVGVRAAALVEADVGLAPGSVEVIPNAVPVIEHPPRSTPAGDRSIVAVSRFDPVKGLDVLVRAAALLDPALGAHVTIYGDGPQRGELEALVDEVGVADRVTFAGWADDVRARLVDHDVFVLPSRLEGMPMSLLEALHAGVAVVSTDVGSVSEVITDGVTGRIVAPDDPAALAAAIGDVLADDAARGAMAAAGRAVALERFSSAANVAAYEAVYDRVLAAPARRRFSFGR